MRSKVQANKTTATNHVRLSQLNFFKLLKTTNNERGKDKGITQQENEHNP